jgi:outer membrane receptor for ferric coprogen and ferric-rhodotorulic acid
MIAAPAAAQEALDPIDIQAAVAADPTVSEGTGKYTVDAITVGSKVPTSSRRTPQTVSVVTRQRIEEQNLHTLSEALQATPGMTVLNNITGMSFIYSRGFALSSVQQDGVPLEYSNNQAYGPLDLAIYDHVEVLRGPGGLFTGAGQPSGTINMVRKRPRDHVAVEAAGTFGSFDFYRGMLDVTGPLDPAGTIRSRFVAAFQDNDYFFDTAHNRNLALYGTTEADLGSATRLRFGASYQRNEGVPTVGLPAYADGRLLDVPRNTFLGARWGKRPNDTINPFAEFTHAFDNGWKLRVASDYFRTETNWIRVAATSGVDPATGLFPAYSARQTRYVEDQVSLDSSLTGEVEAFGRTHRLLAGFNWRNEYYIYLPGSPIIIPGPFSAFLSSAAFAMPSYFPLQSRTDTRIENFGPYASARISLADPLSLVLGGRLTWYQASTQILYPKVQAPTYYGADGTFTPYAALVYDLTDELSAYASYTSIFQPQNLLTYEGRLLEPVEGEQFEVGLKQSLFDNRLEASAAAFWIDQKNTAQADNSHPGSYLPSGGEVESKGVDLQLTGALLPGWNVMAGYTFNPTRYVRDANYQGQAYSVVTPAHIFKLWTNYEIQEELLRGWSVGVGVNAVSRFGNNGYYQDGYATLGARLAYKLNEHVTASVNFDNITDMKYYQTVGAAAYNNTYGEPFSFNFNVRAMF